MTTLCDVTFRVGSNRSTLLGHKSELIHSSRVFRAMLCGPLAEKGHIDVPDVESQDFREFLEFLHTGYCGIHHDNVTTILYLAKKYCVCGLEFLCLKFLHRALAPENACVIMEHAHIFNEKHLHEQAYQVVINNIQTVGDGICNLCSGCFRKIINNSSLTTHRLFNAAILWADAECRRQGREITLKNMTSCIEDDFVIVPVLDVKPSEPKVKSKRLLSEDDLQMLMSFSQHEGENRLLFKRRVNDNRETIADSLVTADVILYNSNHSLGSVSGIEKAEDGIDFTFNTNVMLLSVYLYKPDVDNAHVRLTIQKFLVPVCLEDKEYDVVVSDNNDSPCVEICLKQPLPVMKDVRYCMYASLDRGWPVYTGKKPRSSVTVGECTVTKQRQVYVDTVNMLYGFRVGYLV